MSNRRISDISIQKTSEKDRELYEALLFHFQLNFKNVDIDRIICLLHPMGLYLDKNRMDFQSWLYQFFYSMEKREGVFYDIEQLPMVKYKAGRGFVVYEDNSGNLWYYKDGESFQLSNFGADFWDVKDDIVVWTESSYFFAYCNDEKTEVANFKPLDYQIKNDVLAYRNILGGVNAFVGGEAYELTNMSDSNYSIYGSRVLVSMFNNSYIVLENGVQYKN